MENFIQNHKKLTLVIVIIITLGLLSFIVYSLIRYSSPNQTPSDVDSSNYGEAINVIPYSNDLYSINYNPAHITGVPDKNNLIINALEGYRTAAAQKLYDLGLNPTDYKITFTYENPFKAYE